jgi:hypothetical protein
MESVTADHSEDTNWGDDDPSVFVTNSVAHLEGEYQGLFRSGRGNAKTFFQKNLTNLKY